MLRFISVCCVAQIIVAGADSHRATAELPGQIVATVDDGGDGVAGRSVIVIDPKTGTWKREQRIKPRGSTHLSPDGRTVAYCSRGGVISLVDLQTPGKTRLLKDLNYDGSCEAIWSSDGRELIICSGNPRVAKWRVSKDGRKQKLLAIPKTHAVYDWSPDKKSVITLTTTGQTKFSVGKKAIDVMQLDGSGKRRLVGVGYYFSPRLSPNGKKVLYVQQINSKLELWVVDIDGKNMKRIREEDGTAHPWSACWSPDGEHLAVQFVKKGLPIGEARTWLEIMDKDGENRRKIDPGDKLVVGAPVWRAKPAKTKEKP